MSDLRAAKHVLRAQNCAKKPIKTGAFRSKQLKTIKFDFIWSDFVESTRLEALCESREACFEDFGALILAHFASRALAHGRF